MINSKHLLLILMICGTTLLGSCSKFNALLKSDDVNAKYDEAMRLYHAKKYNKSAALCDNIMPNIVGTVREDTVLFFMGKAYYNMRDYAMAGEAMNAYRDRFTRSGFTEEAEFLYAMSFYKLSGLPENDQADTHKAIIAFNEYLNRYPNSIQVDYIHGLIGELTEKLYYKTYINAAMYHKWGRYNGAITSLLSAIKTNPEIPYREEMTYLICKSWFDYAQNSILARQLDRYLKTIDAYYNFITQYPDNKQFRKDLDKMYAQAKEFTDKYGVRSMAAQENMTSINAHRDNIAQAREALFSVTTKKDRDVLNAKIKSEKVAIVAKKAEAHKAKKADKVEDKLKKERTDKTADEVKISKKTKLTEAPNAQKKAKQEKKKIATPKRTKISKSEKSVQ